MIFYNQRPSAIDRLKMKEWQKSMSEITDAEIISINPDPLGNTTSDNLLEVIENGGQSKESGQV